MCGITGAVWTDPQLAVSEDELERMTRVLAHRGPDDHRTWWSEAEGQARAAFGHRRLSIIDVATGAQPVCNEDGRICLVFNGEIYNYRELRADLVSRGHQFRTAGDSETIVHLYEEYGDDCVDHLRGMFALAIWDSREQRLFLARDRMGQKPLYYRQQDGRILFASELKSLLQVREAPRQLDPVSLDLFLTWQYVPHPHCILRDYQQLPPAHRASWSSGRLSVSRYWRPPFGEPTEISAGENRAALREVVTEAVRLRMRSDVPLGAFLSGGVDSTLIVGLMSQLIEDPVRTFSIGFPEERFDERAFAREAAEQHGTAHTELMVEPSALEILPELIWYFDEPFADSSAIPTMHLSRLTRDHVTVALSGDGGDELFVGYDRYRAVRIARWLDRLPRPFQRAFELGRFIPAPVRQKSRRRRLKRLLTGLAKPAELRYLDWIAIFESAQRQALYSADLRRALDGANAEDYLLEAWGTTGQADFVSRTAFLDTLTYLPCDLLTKVDRASMSCGLECRAPFLDHKVVELAVSLPLAEKQTIRTGKRILKETFADVLPETVRQRPKMGFGVPIDIWFRGELKDLLHDVLLGSQSRERGLFDSTGVRALVEEHVNGHADHAYRLWSLLCLELWQQTFLDPATAPTGPGSP